MKTQNLLTASALSAFMSLSLPEAGAQETPATFNQTLRNGTTVTVDCGKLHKTPQGSALTVAFVAQYEPIDPQAVERLPPWQRQWLLASRNSPSTNPQQIKGLIEHLAVHNIGQDEVAEGYKRCANTPAPAAPEAVR